MKYVCKANIIKDDYGYSAFFPQIEGASAQGNTLFEVLTAAEIALAEILIAYENFHAGRIPEMANEINLDLIFTGNDTLIKVDTDSYRKKPSTYIELWFNPATKKYFTAFADDDILVNSTVEKYIKQMMKG